MKAIFLLLLLYTNTGFAQIPFPVDTIAYNDRFNNREFASYDSDGKIHLTYSGSLGTDATTREIYYVQEQTGSQFNTINITNNNVDDNYPSLSIDANDNIHIGYVGRDAGNVFQIKYANNISGSFGVPMFITAGGVNKATPFSKVGPDSIVHFVFFTNTTGADNIYYTSIDARDTSIQLTPTILAAGETSGDFEATLDIDSQGSVHIVMKTGALAGGPLKYVKDFVDVPTGVAGNITGPKIVIDNNDKVHIIYRLESDLRLYYINNVSGSFSSPISITPTGQRPAFAQNFSIDDSGRVYVVYQSSVAASGRGFYFIYSNQGIFSDTLLIYNLSPEYVTRNSSAVISRGNGDMALFYAPGGVRNTVVICDIFMRRGSLLDIIPVELVSFNASVSGNIVHLNWVTASEINNMGFEVYKKESEERSQKSEWEVVGFVEGKGTTTETQYYSFVDNEVQSGKYFYRLKQIDFDGTTEFSNIIEVEIGVPKQFTLHQNYPNPFNPITVISWQSPVGSHQNLKVYDLLGKEVATLVDEYKPAGSYEIEFNASSLSSGIYIYKLTAGEFTSTKKFILLK